MDMIDQIGGWRSVSGIGARYGEGYALEHKRMWLIAASLLVGAEALNKNIDS